jgi:hypothetical protein
VKKAWAIALSLMFVLALVLSFQGASAQDCGPPDGPEEGSPSANVGDDCVGVYYCVDLQAPYTCKGKYPAIAYPFRG